MPVNDPTRPYNALPLLPPAGAIESNAVLKKCVGARAALAGLKGAGQLIPNQSVLIYIIPILEAKGSSEIENIVTTNDRLFRQASSDENQADPATKEALRYRKALFESYSGLSRRPITVSSAIDICCSIKGVGLNIRSTPGTALRNSHTGETIYTPPEGPERLQLLLTNWERFINEPTNLDPLVKMAIQHYQFEAIHPFTDGNGRTGRVLNLLCLVQDKLLEWPTLYLSRHILRTRGQYYRLLEGVTSAHEWEPWILYMLDAVEVTAIWTLEKIVAIRKMMDQATELLIAKSHKIYSRELIELIFSKPYCRISDVTKMEIAKRQAASTYLKQLVSLDILFEEKVGRDKIFIHKDYLELLSNDDHAVPAYGRSRS